MSQPLALGAVAVTLRTTASTPVAGTGGVDPSDVHHPEVARRVRRERAGEPGAVAGVEDPVGRDRGVGAARAADLVDLD